MDGLGIPFSFGAGDQQTIFPAPGRVQRRKAGLALSRTREDAKPSQPEFQLMPEYAPNRLSGLLLNL
jgi:hypothetical protein